MLELLGRDYVIDHCISRLNLEAEKELYQMYVTESLKIIMENTALLTKSGKAISNRYVDILDNMRNPKPENDIDEQQRAEETILKIKNRLDMLGRQ